MNEKKLIPEFFMLLKSKYIYSTYTKKLNKVRENIKDVSHVKENTILKLRDYNLARFATFVFQMEMLNRLEDEDRGITAAFLYEQMDDYALTEILNQEKECLYLEEKSNLKSEFACLYYMIIETVKLNVDLDVLAGLLKGFVSDNSKVKNFRQSVLDFFYSDMRRDFKNFDKEKFEGIEWNINALFSSLIEKAPQKKEVLQPLFSNNDDKQR